MKRNAFTQSRRDTVGFVARLYPRTTWGVDLQRKFVKVRRLNITIDKTDKVLKAGDEKEMKDTFITIHFRQQNTKSKNAYD